MSTLREDLRDYLQMRRDLGFKYLHEERRLSSFIAFMERNGATCITTRLALDWAVNAGGGAPSWTLRVIAIRGFARHMQGRDPQTEVPPAGLLGYRTKVKPHLYTHEEIVRLMAAAQTLPCKGLRRAGVQCLIGLLAVTGLRVGEALRLECSDVDLLEGLLTIRNTKFGKTRLVPLHDSTRRMLALYAERRDAHLPVPRTPYFLVGSYGRQLRYRNVCDTFIHLSRQIGLRAPGQRGPRMHDFRHRFAIETLLGWYRSGADVEALLPVLSTYLGHGSMHNTYWYLSSCPELMEQAVRRFDRHWEVSP